MIKAVIIDVDDTLCMTEAASFALENEALKRIGRKPMSREVHQSTWGQHLFEAIRERSPGVDVDAFTEAFYPALDEFIADGRLDTVPPENYAALDALIAKGMDIMLLTSRTHGEFHHMLEPDHLLASRVKAFYYKDRMQYHKPDPRAFDELLSEHNLQPEECVYVGDSPSDAKAATLRGLHFIASLESGIRERKDFADYKVDAFIDSFPVLVEAVYALNTGDKQTSVPV